MICNVDESFLSTTSLLKTKQVISSISLKAYTIISYDKPMLCNDLIPVYGIYRSVIKNEKGNVVCFSPPKSVHSDVFIKTYPVPRINDQIIAEEFIEGTMINVFWDEGWELATKQSVGPSKEHPNSFYDMFMDACKHVSLTFAMLNPRFCYSFVLKHPKNKIVNPVLAPEIYLINVYEIVSVTDTETRILNAVHDLPCVKKPQIYTIWANYSDLIKCYGSMNTPPEIVGVMIHNKETGTRCKIRNPVYEEVRHLRGIQPKLQYQYLYLRKEGRVKEFLTTYPEHKKMFTQFRDQLHMFTSAIYTNYISCYIKKEMPLSEFPARFKPHMFNLHKKYMEELRENGSYISKSTVIAYINEQSPAQIMYWLAKA